MSKYYFRNDEHDPEMCFTINSIKQQMADEGIKELTVTEAVPSYGTGMFYCSEWGEIGFSSEGGCGVSCKFYKPRNGKNGRCSHSKNVYTFGENEITIKL